MNILIIDNSVAFTGAFKCALNEADLLSKEHRFVFVLPDGSSLPPLLKDKGYTVYTLPLQEIRKSLKAVLTYPLKLWFNTRRLKNIVKKEQIDVVQMNDFYNLLGSRLIKSGYKGKLITYVRFLPSVIPSPLRKLWTNTALNNSDKVIAVSDAVKSQLTEHEKVVRIYDPVMLHEKHAEKTYVSTGKIKLLYLANYIRGKGHEHALNAFAQALKKNPNMHLTFIGGDMGLEKNKEFKQGLQEKVKQYSICDAVSFSDFNADVESVIKDADIMLNFSEAESFSMTCLEAAYYGTPLIATRCGGPEEIIQHERTGLLVDKGSISQMCDAIHILANNVEKRTFLALAGKRYVREKFSTEQFSNSFNAILQG